MSELNTKQKKELAKQMYLKSQMNQKEIAIMVGVTEKTLSKWIHDEDEKWELLKSSFIITREQELRRIYIQINELNTFIENKDAGKRYASPSESDTLSKLASTARNLEHETSVDVIINVFIEFSEFLKEVDPIKAKEFINMQDAYIKHKLNNI